MCQSKANALGDLSLTTEPIFFSLAPFSIAALLVWAVISPSTALADCPAGSTILEKYTVTECAPGYQYLCTLNNGAFHRDPYFVTNFTTNGIDTSWKLIKRPQDLKPQNMRDTGITPKLISVTATLKPGSAPANRETQQVTCNYNYGADAKTTSFQLQIDEKAKINTIGYIRNSMTLQDVSLRKYWEYNKETHSFNCPMQGTELTKCPFIAQNEFENAAKALQVNGYWQSMWDICQSGGHFGSYACTGQMSGIKNFSYEMESRTNSPKPRKLCETPAFNMNCHDIPAKEYCDDITCQKEIEAMNAVVQEAANYWEVCWRDKPWKGKQVIEAKACDPDDSTPVWPKYPAPKPKATEDKSK